MARAALTSAELGLLRARPQSARYYLAVHRPPVIFQAVLNGVPNNFPGSQIAYTGVTSGAITQVSAGMTLLVGTIAGASNLGVVRIRSSANNVLNLAEFGSGLVDWRASASLTAIEEFAPWPIHSAYQTSTSRWLVDFDLFTSQLVQYGPIALLGPPMVAFMDGATMAASYVGDRSYSLTPGASITSQRWEFPDGVIVTSGLGSSLTPIRRVYLNASPGGRYHSLTVIDGNGASHVGRRLTFSFGSANQPHPVTFDAITGGLRRGGYQTRVIVHSSAGSENFPDGAQVVIFESASYGTSGGSSVGGNYPFRNNVVLAGYVDGDTTRFDPWTGEVSFTLNTIDKILSKTDAYDLFLQGASGGGTAASDWDMAASLSLDRAAIALTKYRSTIANITDVNLASGLFMNEGNGLQFQSLPRSSLWQQLQQNYGDKGMLGLVAADLQSSIYCMPDAQVDGGSANLPITLNITKQDRRDAVTFERDSKDIVSEQSLYAVNGVSPIGAISPGAPTGYFGGRKEVTRGLAACSQDILITWAGNVRARENNTYKRIVVPLAGNMRIDSVPQSRVQMSLSATENVRGIAFNNENLLINETNIRYDAKKGAVLTEVVLEKSVNGIGGSAITFPATGGSSIGPWPIIRMPPLRPIVSVPLPTPIPTTGEHGANMLGIGDDNAIIATTNFLDASPTWTNRTGAITGTLLVFRLDPWDPEHKALCLSDTGLWITSDIQSAIPTWTNVLTLAQMRAGVGNATAVFYAISGMTLSPNVNGYVGLLVPVSGNAIYFGRTNNYSGGASTWTWTLVDSTEETTVALWVSQHTTNNIFIVRGTAGARRTTIFYSTDGGATWSSQSVGPGGTNFNSAGGGAIFIPFSSTGDQIIYIGGNGDQGNGIDGSFTFKTTTGAGGTWSNISYVASNGRKCGAIQPEAFTESPSSDGTNLFLMASIGFSGNNPGSVLLKYDGTTWTALQSEHLGEITRWAGYGFGGWPANNTQLQVHNAGFGAGHVGRSVDGGVTWVDRTGNLAAIGVTTGISYLVPIWSLP